MNNHSHPYVIALLWIKRGKKISFNLNTSLGFPGQAKLIGQHSGGDGGAIVATPAHKHDTKLGHMTLCAEWKLCILRCHLEVDTDRKHGKLRNNFWNEIPF